MRRAAHQLYDNPKILDDPIALPILGEKAQEQVRLEGRKIYARASRYVRAFMVVRSRLAEDELAAAVARGASQYVILGAGLDTFAYRNPYDADRLRVFEVDHPATQKWKRERLAAGRIQIPASVTFAPVDFEKQSLGDGLAAAGFDRRKNYIFFVAGRNAISHSRGDEQHARIYRRDAGGQRRSVRLRAAECFVELVRAAGV